MATSTYPLPGTLRDPLYPDSDGKPLGETPFHVAGIRMLYETLDNFFRDQAEVHVAADQFLHYEQGNPRTPFPAAD